MFWIRARSFFDPEFVAQLRQKKNKRAAKPRFSAPTGDTPQQTDAPTLVEQAVAANVLAEIDGLLTPKQFRLNQQSKRFMGPVSVELWRLWRR